MRVFVAIRALIERDAHVLRLAIRSIGVALGAWHREVKTGQWVAGLGVIKVLNLDGFPIDVIVAFEAVRP